MHQFFITAAKGTEAVLNQELQSLGIQQLRETQGGIGFSGDWEQAYQACLWSRIGSRVLYQLREFEIHNDLDLYLAASGVDWKQWFDVERTFLVDCVGTNNEIRNSQYGALKVKDAIVDHFNKALNQRPDISKQSPDIRVLLYIKREKATLYLDLAGGPLHQRGYRSMTGAAPLKENLAAAIIARAGYQGGTMLDPMCGSGTLVIESAMKALNIAPGLIRRRWGFMCLKNFNSDLWNRIYQDAFEKATVGRSQEQIQFYGYDKNDRVLNFARESAEILGIDHVCQFERRDAIKLTKPSKGEGHLICNPPYGERMGEWVELVQLYHQLGQKIKAQFGGWRISLFSSDDILLKQVRMRAERTFRLYNGALECQLKNYQVTMTAGDRAPFTSDFRNRLDKNLKKISKWAKREQVDCYRIYDADLPEYNLAIDRYLHKVVIQEYAAPKAISEDKTRLRLADAITDVIDALEVTPSQVVLKVRQRQKGKEQYQKLNKNEQYFEVQEYNARFLVNVDDYLDTGLFLDHRGTRRFLGSIAQGKRFLNLFAYTGTASVHAALGGATSTTTVDMSKTYLSWAERNFEINQLKGNQYQFIHADCLKWLNRCHEQYDLIFIDPPTFSNSKRMQDSFDVQRDHVSVFSDLARILAPGGKIIFSNNKRGFKLDEKALASLGLQAKNITERYRSEDFKRNKKIHQCWDISPVYDH